MAFRNFTSTAQALSSLPLLRSQPAALRSQYAAPSAEPVTKVQHTALVQPRQQNDLLSNLISPEMRGDMIFTHTTLAQVSMPRSVPLLKDRDGNVVTDEAGNQVQARTWKRENGQVWIHLQAGVLDLGDGKGPTDMPLPYGATPRLALVMVNTIAIRKQSPQVAIGDTAADFLRMLGMDTNGRAYDKLEEQMNALASCNMTLGYDGRTVAGKPVKQFDAWLSQSEHQRSLWPGMITLSQDYFEDLCTHAMPLEYGALHRLKNSALAIDTYTWLANRLHRVKPSGDFLPWQLLRDQFSPEWSSKDFKRRFLPVLTSVKEVYQAAKFQVVPTGLRIMKSDTPIPSNSITVPADITSSEPRRATQDRGITCN